MRPRILMLSALFLASSLGRAQVASDPSLVFDRIEAMVPMRDGVRLETEVYVPKGTKEKLPILFMRTPYGFAPDARGYSEWLSRPWLHDLLRDGYVLALQSVRGRFGSEGVFVIEPELRDQSDPKSVDEGTDAYDTVEWLLAHVSSNGRVGMLGVSNPARLVAMAMREPHPAVKAYSPQATPADNFLGDDFFHGGAFRQPLIEFVYVMESSKTFKDYPYPCDRADLYDYFLSLGPLSRVREAVLKGSRPTWDAMTTHTTYDEYWKRHSLPLQLTRVPAATLHVGGAYDQEDRRGPVALYTALEPHDARQENFLVVGPWAHQTWRLHEGDRLGAIPFDAPTARFFRESIQAPFFACHLKDRCDSPLPEAFIFQTGTNVWQRLPAWPPRDAKERSLWLQPGGRLAFEPPRGSEESQAFVSDPANPVPSLPRPFLAASAGADAHDLAWSTSLVVDQRFVHGRPDVLSWVSAPLAEDVVVAGGINAHLFVSITGTDADFVAKLIDVFPETGQREPPLNGYQLTVAGEILRGRFRKSFEHPQPFTPNKVEELTIDLLTRSHVFKKGHRIMVQVHSTWFPLYDRNPQTWVDNIFEAKETDFVQQTHRVYFSPRYPSRITFQTTP
jgi:putative CocE/NonD family hydrolase